MDKIKSLDDLQRKKKSVEDAMCIREEGCKGTPAGQHRMHLLVCGGTG
jgi:hypothetical protein